MSDCGGEMLYGRCVFCRLPYPEETLRLIQVKDVPNATPLPAYMCRNCYDGRTEDAIFEKGQ